jgi:hypothetical protein
MSEQLLEFVSSAGQSLRVDREKGVIYGVKLLGKTSKNNRRYTEAAIASAIPLYEGAKVNVDHRKPGSTEPRSYADRMGQIRGARVHEGEAYGDYHFNPKHALAEQLMWDAEHAPQNVGFSHDAVGKTSRQGGVVIVESIQHVNSVDLVADPATNKSLFESETPPEAKAVDLKEATIDQLKAERPDLLTAVLESHANGEAAKAQAAELKSLREQLDTMKAKEAAAVLESAIAAELTEAKLPEAVVTDVFKQQLREAKDATARKTLIEDRAAIVKSAGTNGNPRSTEQRLTEGANTAVTDGKAAAKRWA